jgi:hypothetical protein
MNEAIFLLNGKGKWTLNRRTHGTFGVTIRHASSRSLERTFRSLSLNTRERLGSDLVAVLECLEQGESDK